MTGHIQIDIWGGDVHQVLVKEHLVSDWATASAIIEAAVEAGLLANVLHTDFKAPADKVDAALAALRGGGE